MLQSCFKSGTIGIFLINVKTWQILSFEKYDI